TKVAVIKAVTEVVEEAEVGPVVPAEKAEVELEMKTGVVAETVQEAEVKMVAVLEGMEVAGVSQMKTAMMMTVHPINQHQVTLQKVHQVP
ncbi:MAG: hypothetical protein LIQ31_16445, partial [Planctomycetes bacterium]|nr:hypothetical protein [Planctomycetota bacterium]